MSERKVAVEPADLARQWPLPAKEQVHQELKRALEAVSYTHLDVYKRQERGFGAGRMARQHRLSVLAGGSSGPEKQLRAI